MPTPSDIKRKARKVGETKDELCRGRDRCQGYAYNSSEWWQGEAGKVIRSQYSDIHVDISKIANDMSRLQSCTNRLADNVQAADDERRRRAEEARRQAAAAAAAALAVKKK